LLLLLNIFVCCSVNSNDENCLVKGKEGEDCWRRKFGLFKDVGGYNGNSVGDFEVKVEEEVGVVIKSNSSGNLFFYFIKRF